MFRRIHLITITVLAVGGLLGWLTACERLPLSFAQSARPVQIEAKGEPTLSAGADAQPKKAEATGKKPNIVFILTDNLGYGEIGCYGGGITRGAATPRIDSLAKSGTRLLNMNMETQCTPSRSSLMTGRWAIRSGCHSVPFGGVPDGLTQWEVTIGEALSDAGYATGYYGKWHLGSHDGRLPNDQGELRP